MGESQPTTLEMAPWRDTHNSAPTSETVPRTCYSTPRGSKGRKATLRGVTSAVGVQFAIIEAFLLTDPRQGDWPEVVEYHFHKV